MRRGRDFHPGGGRPPRVEGGTIAPPRADGLLAESVPSGRYDTDPAQEQPAPLLPVLPPRYAVRISRRRDANTVGPATAPGTSFPRFRICAELAAGWPKISRA